MQSSPDEDFVLRSHCVEWCRCFLGCVCACVRLKVLFIVFRIGAAQSYPQLVIARCLTGIGEASFCGLSPTVIDDIAKPHQRTVWLALFFSAIPG